MTAILHLIPDAEQPYQLVRQLVGALAPGSFAVISHAAADIGNGDMASMASRLNELMTLQTVPRSRDQVAGFFAGLDLVEPGLVRVPDWRPALAIDTAAPAQMWAGVASSPARGRRLCRSSRARQPVPRQRPWQHQHGPGHAAQRRHPQRGPQPQRRPSSPPSSAPSSGRRAAGRRS